MLVMLACTGGRHPEGGGHAQVRRRHGDPLHLRHHRQVLRHDRQPGRGDEPQADVRRPAHQTLSGELHWEKVTFKSSVADPDPISDQDPLDPHDFGPPGSGSVYCHAKM